MVGEAHPVDENHLVGGACLVCEDRPIGGTRLVGGARLISRARQGGGTHLLCIIRALQVPVTPFNVYKPP